MRVLILCLTVILAGCSAEPQHLAGTAAGPATLCTAPANAAARYRCEGWSLMGRADANGPDSETLKQEAALRFQIADALDQRGMTEEEAAQLEARAEARAARSSAEPSPR